jgi:hypothetical protein
VLPLVEIRLPRLVGGTEEVKPHGMAVAIRTRRVAALLSVPRVTTGSDPLGLTPWEVTTVTSLLRPWQGLGDGGRLLHRLLEWKLPSSALEACKRGLPQLRGEELYCPLVRFALPGLERSPESLE